mmetsp:Transcript_25700/g.81178  ORF Transcript_25700/g.81178 Transcript_25700/m.81178 type:complete len:351 (+) Transcript_25700:445-1497(+)
MIWKLFGSWLVMYVGQVRWRKMAGVCAVSLGARQRRVDGQHRVDDDERVRLLRDDVLRADALEEDGLGRIGRGDRAGEGRVDALRDNETGTNPGNDQRDDPAEGSLAEHELVDALGALEQRDAGGGADLAMGGRERQANVGADDDDNGGAEFDGETTRWGDDSKLDANGLDDLVPVEEKAEADTSAAERQDPVRVVAQVGLVHDLAGGVGGVDGHEWAHRIGHVVGAVGEGVADGGEDLDIAEHGLSLGVELLGVGVNLLDSRGGLHTIAHLVHVVVDRGEAHVLGLQARTLHARGLGGSRLARLDGRLLGLDARLRLGDALLGELNIHSAADLAIEREADEGDGQTDAA